MLATTSSGRREPVVGASTRRASTSTPFARAFARVASTTGLEVDADDRREAEQRGGDREHARAAADVEQARRGELEQELEAEPRRRVRAGAERAARVDDDRERVGGRRLPRRPDPERADPDRPVELAPAVLPARLDVVGARAAEEVPETLLAACVRTRPARRPPARSTSSNPSGTSSSIVARASSACSRRIDGDSRRGSAERALQLLEEALVWR